jgi:hypothetical protein
MIIDVWPKTITGQEREQSDTSYKYAPQAK